MFSEISKRLPTNKMVSRKSFFGPGKVINPPDYLLIVLLLLLLAVGHLIYLTVIMGIFIAECLANLHDTPLGEIVASMRIHIYAYLFVFIGFLCSLVTIRVVYKPFDIRKETSNLKSL